MIVRELLGPGGWDDATPESLAWLAQLLQDEGVNLLEAESAQMQRGTPVYVTEEADAVVVQRLMAQNHIRVLPVVEQGRIVGLIDLVELALRDNLDSLTAAQAARDVPPVG